MRVIIMLLAAMLLLKTSHAYPQEICSQNYVACVGACVAGKRAQDACIEGCQGKTSACVARSMEGGNPAEEQGAAAAQAEPEEPRPAAKKNSSRAKR